MEPKHLRKPDQTHLDFVARPWGRRILMLLLLVAAAGACAGLVMMISDRSTFPVTLAAGSAVLFVACWAGLQASIPQRVSVRGSVIEIRRDGKVRRFDLEDPGVDILVKDGEIAFAQFMDYWTVVRARDVDWPVFSDVVMHYQNQADHNAVERDKRFRA